MYTQERSICSRRAVIKQSNDTERVMFLTTPPHMSSLVTAQQDVKHDGTAVRSPWEASLNSDRDGAGKGRIVKANSNAQDTIDTEVPNQDATSAMTRTEIQ